MARGDISTSNYLYNDGTPAVGATPLTMAAWVRTTSDTLLQQAVTLSANNDGDIFGIGLDGATGGDPAFCMTGDSGFTYPTARSSSGYSLNTWHHVCGVFESFTSRLCYLDGGNAGTGLGLATPGALSRTTIGLFRGGSGGLYNPVSGSVAEVAIWNVALDAAEVAALGKGVAPILIRSASLRFYAPLIRGDGSGNEPDLLGGFPLTQQGTLTVTDHPRIYRPAPRTARRFTTAAAAPGGYTPRLMLMGVG